MARIRRDRAENSGWKGRPTAFRCSGLLQEVRLALLVYLMLALAWVLLIPPWQGPDEPGHYEYARLLSVLHRPPRVQDANPDLQAEIIRDLDAHDFWRFTRQPRPTPLPARFQEIPFLRRSGTQLGNEPALYYLLPALLFPLLPASPTLHLYLGRLYTVLMGGLLLLVGARAARYRFPTRPELACASMWVLALLPMPTFIHAMFNSNAFKDLVGAALFAVIWAILAARDARPPHYWGGFAPMIAVAAVTGGSVDLLIPVAIGILFGVASSPARRLLRPLLGAILIIGVVFLLFPGDVNRAADWERGPERRAAFRVPGAGIGGSAALYLVDSDAGRRGYLAQNLSGMTLPRVWGELLEAKARVRAVGKPTIVCLSLTDGPGDTSRAVTCVWADSRWQEVALRHRVRSGASFVRLVLGIGAPHTPGPVGAILADDFVLRRMGREENLLRNGGGEIPLSRALFVFAPLLRRAHLLPSPVYTPRQWPLSPIKKLLLAAAVLFTSFWGNYGWLQYPLPVPLYIVLAVVTLLLMVGIVRRVAGHGVKGRRLKMVRIDAMAVGIALVGSVLPAFGADWLPQGRYLFPFLLPLVALAVEGIEAWRPRQIAAHFWIGLWLGGLAAFHLFSLMWAAIAM